MTAIREQIYALIEQRLRDIDGVNEVERMPSGDPDKFPALHIFDADQDPFAAEAHSTRYAMTVGIEGFISGGSGGVAHAALSDLYAKVVAALMTEPPLGGLAETIDEGAFRPRVKELASKRRLTFELDFQITFPTARGDPAQSA